MEELFGRDEELAFIRECLEQPPARSLAVRLTGPPGVGKSAVWAAGIALAAQSGFRTLRAQPAEAERILGHAALGDILEPILDEVLPLLAAPRRQALEVALLRRGTLGETVDARVVGAAVRSSLELVAESGPVLVAVDDVQWLDPQSRDALAFALRRVRQPMVLLLAERTGERPESPPLGVTDTRMLPIGPLSVGALQAMLKQRLDRVFPRRLLVRVHEACAGNPFNALEIARSLGSTVDPTAELPVPASLEELVRRRLRSLSPRTAEALAMVGVLGRVSLEVATRAGIGDGLDDARATGILRLAGDQYTFEQPLLAAVLLGDLPSADRRRAHARAVALVDDPVAKARHVALAADGPDHAAAAAAEEAAEAAVSRGAAGLAAELSKHALRLTPPEAAEDSRRRALAVVRALDLAGGRQAARAMASDLVATSEPGLPRARALLALQGLEPLARAIELLLEALGEATGHPEQEAVIHRELADGGRLTQGQAWAEAHAREAVTLAERTGDPGLLAGCLSILAIILFRGGDAAATEIVRRAYRIAGGTAEPMHARAAGMALAHVLLWSGQTDEARSILQNLMTEWQDRDELWTADAHWYLAHVEIKAGRWDRAAELADSVVELEADYGMTSPPTYSPSALLAVLRGDVARARELIALGLESAQRQGAVLPAFVATAALLELWHGSAADAVEGFSQADRMAEQDGWQEPNMLWWRAEHAEALIELGHLDEAEGLLDDWESHGIRLEREPVIAAAKRCHGLLRAARGDLGGAVETLEESVRHFDRIGDPFGRARSLLAMGVVKRRDRQKALARQDMQEALEVFTRLGASGWVERAQAEIGRIGGRRKAGDLTPVERQVAALVAGGKTNKEVAAALFLSERTVASHLTRIYAKTGVRTRTELASKVQTF